MKYQLVLSLLMIILISGCTNGNNSVCSIENCHGLDIQCGPNTPQVCTAIYQLGDFCRAYATCEVVNGECQPQLSAEFTQCKNCITACEEETNDSMSAFNCEENCRNQIE